MATLEQTLNELPEERREAAGNLLTEIKFIHGTLEKLKANIDKDGAVIKTARTVKENPALRSYNTSIMRYSQLLKQLIEILPEPPKAQESDPLIDFIEGKKQ